MNLQAPFGFEVHSTVRTFIIGKDRLVRNSYSVFFNTIASLSPLLLSPYLTWRLLFDPGTLCQLHVVKLEDILSKENLMVNFALDLASPLQKARHFSNTAGSIFVEQGYTHKVMMG